MPSPFVMCVLLLDLAATVPRSSVTGRVKVTVDGVERADASGVVVYLTGFSEPPLPGVVPEIAQHDRQFEPTLVALTAGQEASFPNRDPFFHNVFSVSPGARFDLGQYRQGETKTRVFAEPGAVEVYCNIHPEMAAKILVLPNRRFTMTRADGSFEIDGVPVGTWSIYAYDRLSSAPEKAEVTIRAGAASEVTFTVVQRHQSGHHKNKYGEEYRDPRTYH